MATRRGIVSLVGVALLLLSQGMEAATVPSADQQPSPLLSTPPYYRFWHGLKLDSLSTDAFRSSLQAFIAATTEVGEGIALVSYLPVLTPTPTAYKKLPGCGGASGWTETALVAYTSEEAYHQLMSSPRGRRCVAAYHLSCMRTCPCAWIGRASMAFTDRFGFRLLSMF